MLLFLGDSSPLGWEVELELKESVPESYDTSNIYLNGSACPPQPPFRPDLAYPQLVATQLQQPFWNLGLGGASYDFVLSIFQKFIKEHEMPNDTTVFLSQVSFFRRHKYDSFNSQTYAFFPYPKYPNFDEIKEIPKICHDAEELLMRTACKDAVQNINHIYQICKANGWNFVLHGIGFKISPEEFDAIDKFCEVPKENLLPELWSMLFMDDLWFGNHPSHKGHEQIANSLIAHYNERFI